MQESTGLITAWLLDGEGGAKALTWPEIEALTPEHGMHWVHLDYTHPQSAEWLTERSGLDPLVSEALLAAETRPRAASMAGGLLINLRGVNRNPGADPEDMVSIRLWCDGKRLVSTRRRRLATVAMLDEQLRAAEGPVDLADLLARLADGMVTRLGLVLDEQGEELAELEEQLLEGDAQQLRAPLMNLRRVAIQLRRYLAPQREALLRLSAERVVWFDEPTRASLRETLDTLTRHIEELDAIRDRATVAYEELGNRLAEQLNQRMYLLSIITGVFLPLGFLTGLLGINVGGIPGADSSWGFASVVVLIALLVGGQLYYFRHKGWL